MDWWCAETSDGRWYQRYQRREEPHSRGRRRRGRDEGRLVPRRLPQVPVVYRTHHRVGLYELGLIDAKRIEIRISGAQLLILMSHSFIEENHVEDLQET